MHFKRNILNCIVLIFLCNAHFLNAQRFSCDGQLLIATCDGINTAIERPVYLPFVAPFLSPISKYFNIKLDALGFNPVDNYIYGVELGTNNIVRLKQGNDYERIGVVSIVDSLETHSGDCTPDGRYIFYEQEINQLLIFNVTETLELIERVDLYWDPSSTNTGAFNTTIFDFAINPNNPTIAIAFQGNDEFEELNPSETRGYLLEINIDSTSPNYGMVTPTNYLNVDDIRHLGALLYGPYSGLYGFGTSSNGFNPSQDQFVSINSFAGEVDNVLTTLKAVYSDGCSCPYAFTFSAEVPTEGMYCNNDVKTFSLSIGNASFSPINDFIIRDTFPEGFIIEEVTGIFAQNVDEIKGIGTNILEITGLDMSGKSNLEINMKVRSVDAKDGVFYNQAFLHDLPDRFDGIVASDDLGTPGAPMDASIFYVVPPVLDEFEWETVSPSDCLLANDGKIIIRSPQFFIGQGYEIRMLNKIGWDQYVFEVEIDSDQSFTLDSLNPGEYQLYQIRSFSENCSFSIKDSIIYLEAPNELLDLELTSNAPLCSGENLLLQADAFPGGDIEWRGPDIFGSNDFDPIIENATIANSGEYKAELTYGYCSQLKFLDLDVYPVIDASIGGDTVLCERDTLKLLALGNGENLNYQWSSPAQGFSQDSIFKEDSISKEEAGMYELIVDNSACKDTARIVLTVLTTPKITMTDIIKTDFCEPVVLEPSLESLENESYFWTPSEGLNCIDCPSPTLGSIVQNSYKLVVGNSNSCVDSSSVEIELDEEKTLYVPNIFNTNSKSGNERFTLFPGCIVLGILEFEVFDRWGSRVFQSKFENQDALSNSWDGFLNKNDSNEGMYVWMAELMLIDGTYRKFKGNITLIRN